MVAGPLDQDLGAAGGGPGDRQRGRGGIGAVLGEVGPLRVIDHVHHQFGEFDHARRRGVLTIGQFALALRSLFDHSVLITQHHGPVAQQEIDELPAVDIADERAVAAGEELREVRREQAGSLVAIHSTRDQATRLVPQQTVFQLHRPRRGVCCMQHVEKGHAGDIDMLHAGRQRLDAVAAVVFLIRITPTRWIPGFSCQICAGG